MHPFYFLATSEEAVARAEGLWLSLGPMVGKALYRPYP